MSRLAALLAAFACVLAAFASGAVGAETLASPAAVQALLPRQLGSLPRELRALLGPRAQTLPAAPASISRLNLGLRDGYRVAVVGIEDTVAVEVRGAHTDVGTLYIARGTVSSRRIAASFGDLGRIDVRFRPAGRVQRSKPRRHCRGPDRFTTRSGVFVGKVRFAGEDDYLSVDPHRVKGRVRSPAFLYCAPPGGGRHVEAGGGHGAHKHPKPGFFVAHWRHGVAAAAFAAIKGFGEKSVFLAVNEGSVGRIATLRYALATAPAGAFVFNNALTAAGVTPPHPFSGSGSYAAAADGATTWTGSLSVSFPGAPHAPLTGAPFEAELISTF